MPEPMSREEIERTTPECSLEQFYRMKEAALAALDREERLREALEPFAEHGRALEGCCPTDLWCQAHYSSDEGSHSLIVADFYAATNAITEPAP